jgi:hypothetical protein
MELCYAPDSSKLCLRANPSNYFCADSSEVPTNSTAYRSISGLGATSPVVVMTLGAGSIFAFMDRYSVAPRARGPGCGAVWLGIAFLLLCAYHASEMAEALSYLRGELDLVAPHAVLLLMGTALTGTVLLVMIILVCHSWCLVRAKPAGRGVRAFLLTAFVVGCFCFDVGLAEWRSGRTAKAYGYLAAVTILVYGGVEIGDTLLDQRDRQEQADGSDERLRGGHSEDPPERSACCCRCCARNCGCAVHRYAYCRKSRGSDGCRAALLARWPWFVLALVLHASFFMRCIETRPCM